jgi:hypothetical protein
MAASFCVTVSVILFDRYENCFVLMQFGRSPFKIPHRLFHGSAVWIRACRFPDMIDFYRELGVQRLSVIPTVTVICGEYSNLWCVRRGGVGKLAEA